MESMGQIYKRAQQGDVTAMELVEQFFLEGKYIQEDRTKAIHFPREAAKYNCLYARDFFQDELGKQLVSNGTQQCQQSKLQNNNNAIYDYMAELSGIFGLGMVKTEVESIRNLIKIQA